MVTEREPMHMEISERRLLSALLLAFGIVLGWNILTAMG
jgi:hypothetical protein